MDRRRFVTAGAAIPGALVALGDPRPASPTAAPFVRRTGIGHDERFEQIAELIEVGMVEHGITGAALGVFKDGETLLRGFGLTSVDDPRAITTDTVFELASLSKTVTATAVMRLVARGRMDLDAPVRAYLPDFRIQDEAASAAITIRHLLTHSAGFEGQLGAPDLGEESLARFAASMAELPAIAPPGEVWGYNNAGFALSGRVIEVVHGEDIHRSLRELVFEPLGLERASTRAVDVMTWPLALGHRGTGVETRVVRPFSMGSSPTAGGVCMSVADLLAFARFHLGAEGHEDVLDTGTLALMRAPQIAKAPADDAMGLGWHLRRLGGVLTASHGGTAGAGHRLLLELVPERGLAFAILTNHVDGWRLIQRVEAAVQRVYEGIGLAPRQVVVHRGVNEDLRLHASALPEQPDPGAYTGTYLRPPSGGYRVRVEDGRIVVGSQFGSSGDVLAFYAADAAFDVDSGTPYEFVRDGAGAVRWIRVNGRIARREG